MAGPCARNMALSVAVNKGLKEESMAAHSAS